MKQYWLRILAIICIALAVCTGAGMFLFAKMNYCKQIISYDGGVAAIDESGVITSVLSTDPEGRIRHVIKTLNTDVFTSKVRNFRILFEGENGELYVMCRVYSENKQEVWEVYRCDWRFSILIKEYTIHSPEGLSFVTGTIPVIIGGKLYLQYQDPGYSTLVTMACSRDGQKEEILRIDLNTPMEIERSAYTDYGMVYVSSSDGVFLNADCIYPVNEDGKGITDGLATDGKRIGFLDTGHNDQVIYQLNTGEFSYREMPFTDFGKLQSVRLNLDGGFTACMEQGEDLIGCEWKRGKLQTYTDYKGNLTPMFVLKTLLAIVVLSVIFVGGWRLLCVRKLKSDRDKGIRFVGIASGMTALSLIVTLLAVPVIARQVYGLMKEQSDFWILSERLSSAKYISSTFYFMMPITIAADGTPYIEAQRYQTLENMIHKYQDSMENSLTEYDFCVMTLQNGEVYCIYSNEFSGTMLADYAVSLNTKEMFRKSLQDMEYRSFEDKRSIGLLEYTLVTYYAIVEAEKTHKPVTVGVVADGYEQRLVYIRMLPDVIKMVGLLVIFLLVTVNLALRVVLYSIKRLGKSLDYYVQTGDYGRFDSKDTTEIGKTAHALRVMAGGLEVHKRDIGNSNLSYQRLISTGILHLLGKDSITQAVIGEGKKVAVFCMRFVFDEQKSQADQISAQITAVMSFVEKYQGDVLDFNRKVLLATARPDLEEALVRADFDEFLSQQTEEYRIQLFIATGEIEVGSAGMEQHAYLVAVGELFSRIR